MGNPTLILMIKSGLVRLGDPAADKNETKGGRTWMISQKASPVVPSSRGGGGGGGGGGRGGYLLQWHANWHCSLTFSATDREHDLWISP